MAEIPKVKIASLPTQALAGDSVLIVENAAGTTTGKTTAADIATLSPPGPLGSLVFEWNGVDTSQFENVSAFFSATSGSPGALSVASTPMGNVLRYSSAGGSGVQDVILAVDPLPFVGESRDHLIEVVSGNAAGTSSATRGGIAMLCDDSAVNFHGFIQACSVNGNSSSAMINNGVVESNAFGVAANKLTRYQAIATKPVAAPPIVTAIVSGYNATSEIAGTIRRTGANITDRGGAQYELGNSSVMGATWDPLALDRWGIGILTQTGGPAPTQWDILALRVFI